ncbi:MAG: methyltransferase domain-containing protein [Deltaproteobacteria bacterium]|nr:methyltransferase domain-containing protein [Deltaproteobacteria bacterium]
MLSPRDILEDAWCYMKSRVLFTAAELDVFTRLEACHYTAAELAREASLDERGATRLLDCLIAMGLLSKEQGRYRLAPGSEPLSRKHPQTILPMILHLNHIWKNWSLLTETVKQGKNEALRKIGDWGGEVQEAFIGAMHAIGQELAAEIAQAYDLSPYRKLLDIGGASGTYTMAFLRQNPAMRAVLFDFAPVLAMAKTRLESEGFLDRVELAAGDFYQDELPAGCDLALLSAIIHQNSPAQNVALYKKIHRALTPGGVVLIRDHIMDESRTQPPAGAMFALNMLVNTEGGDTYTFAEVQETLEAAGFREVKLVRQGDRMDCLVEGRKPV